MLRVSATATDSQIDLQMINGANSGSPSDIEFGAELMQFAESVACGDETRLSTARANLLTIAGAAVLVDAAGVAANFQRMVRIADAIGIPVDSTDNELMNGIREELGLYQFASAANSS